MAIHWNENPYNIWNLHNAIVVCKFKYCFVTKNGLFKKKNCFNLEKILKIIIKKALHKPERESESFIVLEYISILFSPKITRTKA